MSEVEFHPVAKIFPMMSSEEFSSLVEDIRENGLLEPIWLHYDGRIIDGRNRQNACEETGYPATYRTWDGQGSLVSFVVSLNLKRRHLTPTQRATIAVEMLPMLEAEAKERMVAGGEARQQGVEKIPHPEEDKGKSRDKAAELSGANPRYVSDGKRIKESDPEVFEEMKTGALSMSQAKEATGTTTHVSQNSGNNEWYTPAKYIRVARGVMGSIDTDPASSEVANKTVKAERFFSIDDDGLSDVWRGNVWMNPPYAQPLISDFCNAITTKFLSGEVDQAIVLVNNATETAWFQQMLTAASSVCFPKGRIKFLDEEGNPSGAPLQGQAILYFGTRDETFAYEFGQFGPVLSV